jgi:hypothetical protein
MHKIKVRFSDLDKAANKAKAVSDDWQAVILEILLIPNVNKRWKQFNPRYPELELSRHPGEKYPTGLAHRQKIEDWAVYAGYTLKMSEYAIWNSVREGTEYGFSHGPSVCWDGVRRETAHDFAYNLYVVWSLLSQGKDAHRSIEDLFYDYGIIFEDDRNV